MKKGLLALAAGLFLTAGSASAADYYLIGGFNGWSLKQADCKFTESANGEYVLDFQGTLSSGFKINDGTWSNNNANWGGSSTLKVGETYTLQVGGSSGNISLSENIEKPHIVFNPTAGTLLITGQQVETEYIYGVHGSFNGSNWITKDMTEEDGVWTLTTNVSSALSFGIKKMDKSSGAQVEWINSAASAAVTLDTEMPCVLEVGTNWSLNETGDITFKFDPEAMTLTLTGGGGGIAERTIYLAGEFNNYATEDAYKFTKGDGDVYTFSMDELTGNFKIVCDGSWYGTTTPVESGVAYVLSDIGMSNMALASAAATDVNFTFNPLDNTMTVTYDGGDINYSTWYVNIVGDFNSWADNGVNPDAEGISEHKNLPIGTSAFKVKIWNGTEVWHSNGSVIAAGEWVAIPDNWDAGMTIEGAEENSVYDVAFDCKNNQIKVTLVGNEELVYTYALHGNFDGEWKSIDMVETEYGTWAAVDVVCVEGAEFGIKKLYNGEQVDWINNAAYTSDKISGGNGSNYVIGDAETYNFVYNPEDNTLVVDFTTGVNSIEAANGEAVYFNLQGVRVANPENGLFIRVQNGKAVKVVK